MSGNGHTPWLWTEGVIRHAAVMDVVVKTIHCQYQTFLYAAWLLFPCVIIVNLLIKRESALQLAANACGPPVKMVVMCGYMSYHSHFWRVGLWVQIIRCYTSEHCKLLLLCHSQSCCDMSIVMHHITASFDERYPKPFSACGPRSIVNIIESVLHTDCIHYVFGEDKYWGLTLWYECCWVFRLFKTLHCVNVCKVPHIWRKHCLPECQEVFII